jgi:hypothetical protein
MAFMMMVSVALGWDCMGTWEAATWLVTEPARLAMNRWVVRETALRRTQHLGSFGHADRGGISGSGQARCQRDTAGHCRRAG